MCMDGFGKKKQEGVCDCAHCKHCGTPHTKVADKEGSSDFCVNVGTVGLDELGSGLCCNIHLHSLEFCDVTVQSGAYR